MDRQEPEVGEAHIERDTGHTESSKKFKDRRGQKSDAQHRIRARPKGFACLMHIARGIGLAPKQFERRQSA